MNQANPKAARCICSGKLYNYYAYSIASTLARGQAFAGRGSASSPRWEDPGDDANPGGDRAA